MTTATNGGSAANSDSGSAASGNVEDKNTTGANSDSGGTQANVISAADHKRALDDLKKFKQERDDAKKELQAQKDAKLKEANDFKALYESEKSAREAEAKEKEAFQATVFNNLKLKALEAEAAKLGILPGSVNDLDFLDLSAIEVETTNTGRHLVKNADRLAAQLKKTRPHWFSDSKVPNFNAGGAGNKGGGSGGGDITATDVFNAEKKAKMQPTAENKTAYQNAVKKYTEQRKAAAKV